MKLARWESFSDADDFFRQFGSSLLGRWPALGGNGGEAREWTPAADISETDKEYLVKAELPGMKPGDIKVSLDKGVLSIEGERKYEKDEKNERTHRIERFYGSFSRRFVLPEDADAGAIRAEGKEGVLTVHLPKKPVIPAAQPKQIKVE